MIKMAIDLFEAILNPLIDAAMSSDDSQGIFRGAFFGPYKNGLWPLQAGLMRERARANPWVEPIKQRYDGPAAGGNSQLNSLFYALYVFKIVQAQAEGVTKGLEKHIVSPITKMIQLLCPAEIGGYMIGKMPKLIARGVVGPVTHGVIHSVTHAVGHTLSKSVTTAVVHSLTRAQTHYYYCLYCYYHGSYCQFCEFYNEYSQLGNRAEGWGHYKEKKARTEYARETEWTKAHWSATAPHEPHWDTETACYSHFRPRGCMLGPERDASNDVPVAKLRAETLIQLLEPPEGLEPCTEEAVKSSYTNLGRGVFESDKLRHGLMDGAITGDFADCRLSDMAEYLHQYAMICVLTPKETRACEGERCHNRLEYGLRMRVRQLPLLERVHDEAPAGPECDYSYASMTPGAETVLSGDRELRKKAFRRCRHALEKFMVLAKYDRFRACVRELDTKRGQPRGAVDAFRASAEGDVPITELGPNLAAGPSARGSPRGGGDGPPDVSARFQNNEQQPLWLPGQGVETVPDSDPQRLKKPRTQPPNYHD